MISWTVLAEGDGAAGLGEQHCYLVSGDAETGVIRLSRWRSGAEDACWQVLRNLVMIPLGRGPGRPAAGPEMIAAMTQARHFCERWEEGWPVGTAPTWTDVLARHPGLSDAAADAEAEADAAEQRAQFREVRFPGSGPVEVPWPAETGEPWRSAAEREWDDSRD